MSAAGLKKTAAGKAAEKSDEGATARIQKLIEAAADKAPSKISPYISKAAPFIAAAVVAFQVALPYVVSAIVTVNGLIAQLPEKLLYAGLGFLMCFFGGVFPATIAAFEAWNVCGGNEAIEHIKTLYRELETVQNASKEDDKKDDDNDGIADVDQISGAKLLTRKTLLTMREVNPDKFNSAVGGLYIGWIGVLAILKIQFAKTITLGQVIGDKLYAPVQRIEPALMDICEEDYRKWVPVVLKWTCKVIAISIAWWIQRVISAVHSAIRGGLMFGKYVVNFLHEKGYLKTDDKDTYMDEVIGWGIALSGFLFQFFTGFRAPFPLNLVLFPVQMIEWFVVGSISTKTM